MGFVSWLILVLVLVAIFGVGQLFEAALWLLFALAAAGILIALGLRLWLADGG